MAKYSFSTTKPHAKAIGQSLSISTKHSIEIADLIRGKKVLRAKQLLQQTVDMKQPIPFKKYTGDVGHRRGKMASGRYPVKACGEILNLLNSAQANAESRGLSTDDLVVKHIVANKGPNVGRFGRQRGRKAKRTHVEIILTEKKTVKKEAPAKKQKPTKVEEKPEPAAQHSKEEKQTKEPEVPEQSKEGNKEQ